MANETQRRRNEVLRKVDLRDRSHVGCVRFGKNESKDHRGLKIKECNECFDLDLEFLTEAHIGERIADVVILDWNKVVEIGVSETEESLLEKKKYYTEKGFRYSVRQI